MKYRELHSWQVSTAEAREIQLSLAARVSRRTEGLENVRLVAGSDISVDRASGMGRAAVVVLSYPALEILEVRLAAGKLDFPYVPGLLSFREAPLLLKAWEQLILSPDLLLADGQGLAHPRRMGIACHLGLLVDIPTIGCAKSRLCGEYDPVGEETGAVSDLMDQGEVIGTVLRTRSRVAPVYVSIGHKIDLASAVEWVLRLCRGFRLPEPARLAHQAARGHIEEGLRSKACPAGGRLHKKLTMRSRS